jgi:ubiquinone/menaquinone biosynthesis C-methylase UbiE
MTDTETTPDQAEAILSILWERNYDPLTRKLISGLPLGPNARCLDIGAGAGSMSAWLVERTPQGSVLALDVETRQLDGMRSAGLTVRQGDAETEQFAPGSFDFILARAVLSAVSHPDELLTRAVRWLAPGGWILVQDFYFMPAQDAVTPYGRAVLEAYLHGFQARGADMRFARRVPARLAAEGLTDVDLHVWPLGPGAGEHENELMRRRLELQGQPLVDNGWVSAADLGAFIANLDRPEARDVTTLMFSVWGQRPPIA